MAIFIKGVDLFEYAQTLSLVDVRSSVESSSVKQLQETVALSLVCLHWKSLHKPLRYRVDQPHSRSLLITLKTILPHLIVCIETQSGVVV